MEKQPSNLFFELWENALIPYTSSILYLREGETYKSVTTSLETVNCTRGRGFRMIYDGVGSFS